MTVRIRSSFLILVSLVIGCTANHSTELLTIDNMQRLTQVRNLSSFSLIHQQITTEPKESIDIKIMDEKNEIEVSGDITILAMSFNGSVPTPVLVEHQDKHVVLTIVHPKPILGVQNIDFNAATGPLGSWETPKVNPNIESAIRFRDI